MKDLLGTKLERKLKDGFGGEVLTPADDGYESARQIWNAMIDKRPAVIARCATTSDVVRAVEIAREAGLVLAVRGGGHHIAGNALSDGGMVIDLSRMRSARVDARTRRAIVEGGATLADLDAATQAHALATPVGINSTTGIGGLTLGGGFGWLSRKYGMTIDNLESAELVTAAGEVKRVSQDAHADLFWALRGGGGNFGVVTRFEFRLHPVGPNLLCGLVVYPASAARPVLRQYREFMAEAPDELTAWAVLRAAPPLPFLPESVHGQKVLVLAFLYAGDPEEGAALVEPLRRLDTPVGEHVGIQPYVAWQQLFDPLLTAGARNYWKSHNFARLDDGLLDAALAALDRLPSPQCEIFLAALGGATTRPAAASTAYPHRDARFVMNVHGRWDHGADDDRCVSWARQAFDAAAPFATGGVYVNFMTADEGERVRAAYGGNHRRLAAIKAEYDPNNLFRTNQNIRPG
jgi:FAD/FMN-containing dehydrogenase